MNFYKQYLTQYKIFKRKDNMEAIAVVIIIILFATGSLG